MLARSIDADDVGPTFEERLFKQGKTISIAIAVAALGIAALDMMNASALTTIAAALRDGRLHYDEMPARLLAGIRQISIYDDRASVVVAVPRDVPASKSVAVAPPAPVRPVATLYDPVKPAPVAAERQRLALNKPAPAKTEPAPAAPPPPARRSPPHRRSIMSASPLCPKSNMRTPSSSRCCSRPVAFAPRW